MKRCVIECVFAILTRIIRLVCVWLSFRIHVHVHFPTKMVIVITIWHFCFVFSTSCISAILIFTVFQ